MLRHIIDKLNHIANLSKDGKKEKLQEIVAELQAQDRLSLFTRLFAALLWYEARLRPGDLATITLYSDGSCRLQTSEGGLLEHFPGVGQAIRWLEDASDYARDYREEDEDKVGEPPEVPWTIEDPRSVSKKPTAEETWIFDDSRAHDIY